MAQKAQLAKSSNKELWIILGIIAVLVFLSALINGGKTSNNRNCEEIDHGKAGYHENCYDYEDEWSSEDYDKAMREQYYDNYNY